jgi:hypothetical protein
MQKIALLKERVYGIMFDEYYSAVLGRRCIGLELTVFQLWHRYALNDTILSITRRL